VQAGCQIARRVCQLHFSLFRSSSKHCIFYGKGNWVVLIRKLLLSWKLLPNPPAIRLLLSLLCLVVWQPLSWAQETTSPSAETTVSLRLNWFHQFEFAGYYAALEKGFFTEEGLNVHILERDPGTAVVDDVVSGHVDFGVADSSLIVARMNGKPVVMVSPIFQHSPMVLISLAENNILGPADLVGKKIMYQLDHDDAVIAATLNEVGLGQKDIISVPHSFDDWALLNPDVTAMSAYISNQPYLYRKKNIKINIIDPANYGVDFYGDSLFTSESMVNTHPNVVSAFQRATIRGWVYALDHSEEIIDLILRKYQPEKTREQLVYEAKSIRRMIQPDLLEIGLINRHRFDRIADIYRERGRVPLDTDLTGFFADDYLIPEDIHSVFLHWIVPLAIISMVVLVLMFVINKRLQKIVYQKTHDADEAREKAERYLAILDRHTCVMRVDRELKIQHISAAFCELTGYESGQLLGKPHTFLMDESSNGLKIRQLLETASAGQNWQGEVYLKQKNGDQLVMDVFVEPVQDGNGKAQGYNAVYLDMTQKKNAELLSITDTLTNLYNRNKIDTLLVKESKLVNRGSPVFSIILLDIDHFKHINDEYGHLMGDQVLREIARCLKRNIRETDYVGRWGGEEFMVICANTSLMGAEALAEMLRTKMERAEFPEHIHATSSFGVAEYSPGESIDNLIKRADEGLYWAKNSGRNCVRARPCHVGSA